MFSENFKEVLKHNGVVSMTTWSEDDVHVSNTWNSYLELVDDNKILIPAAWLFNTEKNIDKNNKMIVTLGSPDVQGKMYLGTGYVIEGTAKFLKEGEYFDMMKEKFSFTTRVLEVTCEKIKQTI